LLLASAFSIGLRTAFGLIANEEQFIEAASKIGEFRLYADYLVA
jgi:hypothetical protein